MRTVPNAIETRETEDNRMMSERPLLMSEKVMFAVAGPPALLGMIVALFI